MASSIQLSGVDDFLAELARLAPDLADEATTLEDSHAQETARELRAAYPAVTGRLRASVQVQRVGTNSPARVATQLQVTAPYAEFFEFGTSRTAPHPTFVPIQTRGRAAFVASVVDRVKARGLQIHGEAA